MRYEIMLEREDSLGEVIAEAWAVATPKTDLGSISKALKGVCSLK
jgi:hypothetical protein